MDNNKDFNIFNQEIEDIDPNTFILWQFRNTLSEKLLIALTKFFNENVLILIKYIKENILNLETADDYGLSYWGKIYKVSRVCVFENETFILDTEEYRELIKAKILLGNIQLSMAGILEYLDLIFPGDKIDLLTAKNVYYYTLSKDLSNKDIAKIMTNNLLPYPEGCVIKVRFVLMKNRFGFSPDCKNFNSAPFGAYREL